MMSFPLLFLIGLALVQVSFSGESSNKFHCVCFANENRYRSLDNGTDRYRIIGGAWLLADHETQVLSESHFLTYSPHNFVSKLQEQSFMTEPFLGKYKPTDFRNQIYDFVI